MIDLNPIDVLNNRTLTFLPPHFAKMKLGEISFQINEIEDWIKTKLKGRFSLVQMPSIGTEGKLKNALYVGFEDHKELTYFMLGCPYIRRNK